MPLPPFRTAALATSTLLAASLPGHAASDPAGAYLGRHRVLLVSAADVRDPLLDAQRHSFAAMQAGARERDLALVEAVGDTPQARTWRQKFGIEPTGFEVLLIGKDGGEKARSAIPLGPNDLFPTIDAMPMRRSEMRRKS